MKPVIIFLVVASATLFCIQQGVGCSVKRKKEVVQNHSSSIQKNTPTSPKLPAEQQLPVAIVPPILGWNYHHQEVNPENGNVKFWFLPESYTAPTKWIQINGFDCDYRLKADAIVEFESEATPKTITSFKHEASTGNVYLESNGSFAQTSYPLKDLQILAKVSESFRFRPINGQPMTGLKISKVE